MDRMGRWAARLYGKWASVLSLRDCLKYVQAILFPTLCWTPFGDYFRLLSISSDRWQRRVAKSGITQYWITLQSEGPGVSLTEKFREM